MPRTVALEEALVYVVSTLVWGGPLEVLRVPPFLVRIYAKAVRRMVVILPSPEIE